VVYVAGLVDPQHDIAASTASTDLFSQSLSSYPTTAHTSSRVTAPSLSYLPSSTTVNGLNVSAAYNQAMLASSNMSAAYTGAVTSLHDSVSTSAYTSDSRGLAYTQDHYHSVQAVPAMPALLTSGDLQHLMSQQQQMLLARGLSVGQARVSASVLPPSGHAQSSVGLPVPTTVLSHVPLSVASLNTGSVTVSVHPDSVHPSVQSWTTLPSGFQHSVNGFPTTLTSTLPPATVTSQQVKFVTTMTPDLAMVTAGSVSAPPPTLTLTTTKHDLAHPVPSPRVTALARAHSASPAYSHSPSPPSHAVHSPGGLNPGLSAHSPQALNQSLAAAMLPAYQGNGTSAS
jgi:hypothetical protein